MINLIPYSDVEKMALATAKSGMFGLKSEHQALTLMMIAQAEGIHPIQAVQMYSIINGMPALKSTEVQARFQRAGGKVTWLETSTEKAICKLQIDGQEFTNEFTIKDAARMGLAQKDNWVKMPKQMLMARCVTMGVRAIYPQCLNNMYSVDEVQDFDNSSYQEAEIIEPDKVEPAKITNTTYKSCLQKKLKEMQLGTKEIKQFAEMYKISEDENLLIELCNDDTKLEQLVSEFEKTLEV